MGPFFQATNHYWFAAHRARQEPAPWPTWDIALITTLNADVVVTPLPMYADFVFGGEYDWIDEPPALRHSWRAVPAHQRSGAATGAHATDGTTYPRPGAFPLLVRTYPASEPPQPRRLPVTSHRFYPCPASGPAACRLPTGLRQPLARWRGRAGLQGTGRPRCSRAGRSPGGQHEAGGQTRARAPREGDKGGTGGHAGGEKVV